MGTGTTEAATAKSAATNGKPAEDKPAEAVAEQATATEPAETPVVKESAKEQPVETALGVSGILTTTQDRVAEILAATEAAAADIVEAANAESERLVQAAKAESERVVRETHAKAESLAQSKIARIDSVTDSLLSKAGSVEAQIEGFRKMMDDSIEALAKEFGIDGDSVEPVRPAPTVVPAEGPATETGSHPVVVATGAEDHDGHTSRAAKGGLLHRMRASTKRDASEGVKLLATQMIAAGHTWEEARVRLNEEFGVKDPTIALDAVYRDGEVPVS